VHVGKVLNSLPLLCDFQTVVLKGCISFVNQVLVVTMKDYHHHHHLSLLLATIAVMPEVAKMLGSIGNKCKCLRKNCGKLGLKFVVRGARHRYPYVAHSFFHCSVR
jgi:hypothetical protein